MTSALQNTKAILGIGGYNGSEYFSTNFATADSRSTFVDNISKAASQYELDGVMIKYVGQTLVSSLPAF